MSFSAKHLLFFGGAAAGVLWYCARRCHREPSEADENGYTWQVFGPSECLGANAGAGPGRAGHRLGPKKKAPLKQDSEKKTFETGDLVFVTLGTDRANGLAVVEGPLITEQGHRFCGRHLVRYTCDNKTAHVRPSKMTRRISRREPVVVVCAETTDFRRMARTQVQWEDFVIELGSCYGHTTCVLAEQARRVIGVDHAEEFITESRVAHPDLEFARLDVLDTCVRTELLEMAKGSNVFFIDIGGDREVEAVLDVVRLLQTTPGLKPTAIFIKSRKLVRSAEAFLRKSKDGARCTGPHGTTLPFVRHWHAHMKEQRKNIAWWQAVNLDERSPPPRWPEKYPVKKSPDGRVICRFYNYGACSKSRDECSNSHDNCHNCLAPSPVMPGAEGPGHIGKNCTRPSQADSDWVKTSPASTPRSPKTSPQNME